MNRVDIKDNDTYMVLYISKDGYYGYKFNPDNSVKRIDQSIFNYFDFLRCSDNNTALEDEDGYKVLLDNTTNLKHYYKNSVEDYKMFMDKNARSCILNKYSRGLKREMIVLGVLTFILSIESAVLINQTIHNKHKERLFNGDITAYESYEEIEDISFFDIKQMINNSQVLTDKEKQMIINDDFFSDLLPTINTYSYIKHTINERMSTIKKDSYSYDEFADQNGYYSVGQYSPLENIISISDYDYINYYDTFCHEFVHLCQAPYTPRYNVLVEACAEIISNEYYNTPLNSYNRQVKVVKKLMEITGSEAIWTYNFTNDFSMIEKKIKPILSDEEYELFLDCLSFDYDDDQQIDNKMKKLNELISIMYKNIYDDDISNSEIMNAIQNEESLNRYYFNERLINEENSYYYTYELDIISMEQAIEKGIVQVMECTEKTDKDGFIELLKNENYPLYLAKPIFIDGFRLTSTSFDGKDILYSGYYNGEYIINVNDEELLERGLLIAVNYFTNESTRVIDGKEYLKMEDKSSVPIVLDIPPGCIKMLNSISYTKEVKKYLPTTKDVTQTILEMDKRNL